MTDYFFISDTHYGHENACTKFKRPDGTPLRDFASAAEADEYMIEQWNKTVKPTDKVYHLGDVVINKKFLPTLEKLNGRKTLIRGNHCIYPIKEYLKYFDEVHGVRVRDKLIMSHVPLHPECVDRFSYNVHGHLHYNVINDPRYISVCVEQIHYTPIHYDDLLKRVEKNKDSFSQTGHVINFADIPNS